MYEARIELECRGYEIQVIGHNEIHFEHNGHLVKFFTKKAWATGKSIKDGRGIDNLLKQLK